MFMLVVAVSDWVNRVIGPFDDAEAARQKADATLNTRYVIVEVEPPEALDPPEPVQPAV